MVGVWGVCTEVWGSSGFGVYVGHSPEMSATPYGDVTYVTKLFSSKCEFMFN